MNRRDVLKGVGAGSLLGIGVRPASANSRHELLNAYFEVDETGDAEFVIRFNPRRNFETSNLEPENHIQFPGLPDEAVEFFSTDEEEITVSTLVENEDAWIGSYSDAMGNASQSGGNLTVDNSQWITEETLPKEGDVFNSRLSIGSQSVISIDPTKDSHPLDPRGWLDTRTYARPLILVGGRIKDFASIENREHSNSPTSRIYHANTAVVFSETIHSSRRAKLQIRYPPDVTYEASALRKLPVSPSRYDSSRSDWAQIPRLSHRDDIELAASANGMTAMRRLLAAHEKSNLYSYFGDQGNYSDNTVEEIEGEVAKATESMVNNAMWAIFGTTLPIGSALGLPGISGIASFGIGELVEPMHETLMDKTEVWDEVAMKGNNSQWMAEAHRMINGTESNAGMLEEFQTLESDAYRALLAETRSEFSTRRKQIATDANQVEKKLDDYDLRQVRIDGSKAIALNANAITLKRYQSQILSTTDVLLQETSTEPSDAQSTEEFSFNYNNNALTITYNGDDSWESKKLFVAVQNPGENIGFLWSDLSEVTTITTDSSVTIDPQEIYSSHQFDLDSAIVDVNYEETHGTATENLAQWRGPDAPDDGWEHNPSEETQKEPPQDEPPQDDTRQDTEAESDSPPETDSPGTETDSTSESNTESTTDSPPESTNEPSTDTTSQTSSEQTPESSTEPTQTPPSTPQSRVRRFGSRVQSGFESASDTVSDLIDGIF